MTAAGRVRIVPANEAGWDDLQAVLGARGYAARCQCQRLRVEGWIWRDSSYDQRVGMLREQTGCDDPEASATSGLVAFVDGEPAGWASVAPRVSFPKLRSSRVPWKDRHEDPDDPSVWSVTCMVVRAGYRGRGLTYQLARAAIEHARSRGAHAVEAYPMITEPGREVTWGELNVGAWQVFEEAGFRQVSKPTKLRVVMRVDLGA